MTRRTFAAALAGAAALTSRSVTLEALYGERLPAMLRLERRRIGNYPYFELRVYSGKGDTHRWLEDVFAHAGLRPIVLGDLRFLFPFGSLEQRARVWDKLNSDPEWIALRETVRLSGLTIYRTRQPGGRIFEMSL